SNHYDRYGDVASSTRYAQEAVDTFESEMGVGDFFADSVPLFASLSQCFIRLFDDAIARGSIEDIVVLSGRMNARLLRILMSRNPEPPSRNVPRDVWTATLARIEEAERDGADPPDDVLDDLDRADIGVARFFSGQAPVFEDIARWVPQGAVCISIAPAGKS